MHCINQTLSKCELAKNKIKLWTVWTGENIWTSANQRENSRESMRPWKNYFFLQTSPLNLCGTVQTIIESLCIPLLSNHWPCLATSPTAWGPTQSDRKIFFLCFPDCVCFSFGGGGLLDCNFWRDFGWLDRTPPRILGRPQLWWLLDQKGVWLLLL